LGRRRLRVRDAVEAVLLEELIQGDAGDADREGIVDEVEEVGPCGVGVVEKEVGDGAGIAWQELAIGTAVHAMVGLLDGLEESACCREAVGRLMPSSRAMAATFSPLPQWSRKCPRRRLE
jgi:hypothetical protein